jgi:phosphoglucosamine mutase
MKPKLFGSSGIRGLANVEITPDLAMRVGAAIATLSPGGTTVVGRDARLTGPMLEGALTSGIASCGGDPLSIGLVPTPITAWMIKESGSKSGVQITASHNPPQYNGLKIFNEEGMSLTLKEQLQIEKVLNSRNYGFAEWNEIGTLEEVEVIDPYIENILDQIELRKTWKIALDLFCGATSTLAPQIFEEFGVETLIINGQPDGRFPAGNPEPNADSLKRLGEYMKRRDCQIGFGFDGDGDRMMAVTSKGEMASPDQLLAAYAGYIIESHGGGVAVTHVGTSMNFDDMVKRAGGKVVRTPVGDSFITEAMKKHDAVFGGEPVGAWVHPEFHMCPDGVLSSLLLLKALEEKDLNLNTFIGQAEKYPIQRRKLECSNILKQKTMESIAQKYSSVFKRVKDVNNTDGVRLQMENGWVLIRPSGTEPIIRITVEGKTKGDMETLMNLGDKLVKNTLRENK